MATIKITIRANRGEHTVDRTIDEDLYELVFMPVDLPNGDDAFTKYLCTDEAVITRTLKARDRLVKILSRSIAEELAKMMGEKDTVNGYAKSEQ